MDDKYKVGDTVVIREISSGRLKPNEIGIIKGINHSFLYPYTVFSLSKPYKYDAYGSEEIMHLF